ncbi:MAG TPA: ribose-phosphate pyrophosphokinase [Gemmatimonadaceae bacterium]|nr:ribose-phosphate pyrophosphokinase [Gemmatimonadaceae bacterium]
MTAPTLLIALPTNEPLLAPLLREFAISDSRAEPFPVTIRRFPDSESYVRLDESINGREVALVCTLDRPDDKILALLFLASTARDLGAARVGLIAPYLAYMRQDRRFEPGEALTSTYFAELLSDYLDWLVTVDPHLHRRSALGEIYSIPTHVVHAAPRIAEWIQANVRHPVLIGPDEESAQWVAMVAEAADAPWTALRKERRGDRDVSVSVPEAARWLNHTPVLVDDIISTARTMIATVRHLLEAGLGAPECIGVHAVFAPGAFDELRAAGAARIVTCNTIPHLSNGIDLSADLARAAMALGAPRTPT